MRNLASDCRYRSTAIAFRARIPSRKGVELTCWQTHDPLAEQRRLPAATAGDRSATRSKYLPQVWLGWNDRGTFRNDARGRTAQTEQA